MPFYYKKYLFRKGNNGLFVLRPHSGTWAKFRNVSKRERVRGDNNLIMTSKCLVSPVTPILHPKQ